MWWANRQEMPEAWQTWPFVTQLDKEGRHTAESWQQASADSQQGSGDLSLTPRGTKFSQQPRWARKWIFPWREEGTQPWQTSTFAQGDPGCSSDLQYCTTIHLCCLNCLVCVHLLWEQQEPNTWGAHCGTGHIWVRLQLSPLIAE